MVADLLRIGVRARLDRAPEREVHAWRCDLERGLIDDPAETRARLNGLDRGEYVIVELHLFAELSERGSLTRCGDTVVSGCWFSRSQRGENLRHTSELVKDHLDDLQNDLASHGLGFELEELASLPIQIRLDEALVTKLDHDPLRS